MEQRYFISHSAKDFRRMAWQALTGIWGIAIIAAIVYSIIGGSSLSFNIDLDTTSLFQDPTPEQRYEFLELAQNILTHPLFIAAASIGTGVSLVKFIIGGAVKVGYSRFMLKVADKRETPELKELFSCFDRFGEAFVLNLLVMLKTIAWSLLFIIPGIVAAYRYSMAFNVMAEHPELKASACIERSKELMYGNKWNLFCLHLSFIGWFIVTILTLGIFGFWLAPFTAAAEAYFYRDISGTCAETSPLYAAPRGFGGAYGNPYGNPYATPYAPPTPPAERPKTARDQSDDFRKNW